MSFFSSKEHIPILMFLQIYIVQQQCLGARKALVFTPLNVGVLGQGFCAAVTQCRAAVITSHATPQKPVFLCYTRPKIPKWNPAMLSKHFPVFISNVISYIN